MNYHCSISEIQGAEDEQLKHDLRPFRSQAEMTKVTGLPLDAWLSRQAILASSLKNKRQSKNDLIEEMYT